MWLCLFCVWFCLVLKCSGCGSVLILILLLLLLIIISSSSNGNNSIISSVTLIIPPPLLPGAAPAAGIGRRVRRRLHPPSHGPPGLLDGNIHQTLESLNHLAPSAPLGLGWDIDFILLQVSPAALPHFSPWWTLCGTSTRSAPHSPFPEGLELVSASPFTLRVQPSGGLAEDSLASWGLLFNQVVSEYGETNQPTLVQPLSQAVASKQLSQEPRLVTGVQLMEALQDPRLGEFTMFLGRYGLKVPAEPFFNQHLLPAMAAMAAEVTQEEASVRWAAMQVDWATQSHLQGSTVLVKPLHSLRELAYAGRAHSIITYPLFGRLGGGFGGMYIRPAEPTGVSQKVSKVSLYPAGWVHHLKGMGLPALAIPSTASNAWIAKQGIKLYSLLDGLDRVPPHKLGGIRFEVRTNGCFTNWVDVHEWLEGILQEVMPKVAYIQLLPSTLVQDVRASCNAAKAAGLFSMPGASSSLPLEAWRKKGFYRLLQCFGLVNPRSCKSSMLADLSGLPWGNPLAAMEPMAHGIPLNPILPPDTVLVQITPAMPSVQVALLGRSRGASAIDWHHLATTLGFPELGDLLRNVAISTKWRRAPSRKPVTHGQITTCLKVGKGTVGPLGDSLQLAVLNLVAKGLQDKVILL